MDMDYAEAINVLEDGVDQVVNSVLGSLSPKEVAVELRRIADSWEQEDRRS